MLLPIVVVVAVLSRIETAVTTKSCEAPKDPGNGIVTYTLLSAGSQLTFLCNNGYHLQDTRPVYCTSDGEWSNTDVKCVAKTCDPPEHPKNGQVNFSSLTFRSRLKFKCDDGYRLKSNEPVFCTSEGTWSNTDVQCVAETCDLPEHPENGQVIFTSLNTGSQLTFKCNDGYGLKSDEPVFCRSDGSWSKIDVQCVATTCDLPEHPDNGQVIFTSLNFGSQLKFKCDYGYHLNTNTPAFCTSDGTWNSTDVQCVVDSNVDSEGSDDEYIQANDWVRVPTTDQPIENVSEGFEKLDGTDDVVTDENISVYPENNDEAHKPTEVIANKSEDGQNKNVCGPPPKIEGTLPPDPDNPQAAIGTTITYRCEFGYVNQDSKDFRSTCVKDAVSRGAKWTTPDMVCIPRSCGEPGFVSNANRIGNLFTFPNKVEFQCQEGYKLKGTAIRFCQASGSWSGRLPKCDQIYCARPENPENGRVRYISLEYGTELKYECDKGFVLSKHEERTCTEDGTWSNSEPVCIEGSCDMPVTPKHGTLQMAGTPKVGTVALYSCKEGKTMVGPSVSKCLITGQWTFPPPKCVSPCVLPFVRNGGVGFMETRRVSRYRTEESFVQFQVGKIFKDEETAIFRCKDSYEPVGNSQLSEDWRRSDEVVTCNDGQWSKSLECKPESCYGEPPYVDNGSPVVNNNSHGVGIDYNCDIYYVKAGRDNVICSYGKWTGRTPTCIDGRCYASQLNHPGVEKPSVEFIEHGKDYPATCMKGFKASRTQIKISCNTGMWNVNKGICVEESCEGDPPPVDNGYPVVRSRSHGSGIYYRCNKYYEKGSTGEIKCSYGKWTGYTPTCIDGRCYSSQLNHPGVEKPSVEFIEHGKDYPVTCTKGFRPFNQWIKLSCNTGNWNVAAARCVEDICSGEPPKIPNGSYYIESREYNSEVVYECDPTFELREHSKVQCQRGVWTGQPPSCGKETCTGEPPKIQNGRYYIESRAYNSEVVYECDPTYDMIKLSTVQCLRGEWTGQPPVCDKAPPENCFCTFNHSSEYLEAVVNGESLKYGGPVKKGSAAVVSCTDPGMHLLLPNGTRIFGRVSIMCKKCQAWESNDLPSCERANSVEGVITTTASAKAEERTSRQPENCFCTFNHGSVYLNAAVNEVSLKYGDTVRKYDAAALSCKDSRLHLFWPNGMRTFGTVYMTCEVCQAWGLNNLPSCVEPHPGDSFIVLNEKVKVQPGGAVESHLGTKLQIGCMSWNIIYPDWKGPTRLPVSHNYEEVDAQHIVYRSFVHIENFGQQHAGRYECFARNPSPPHQSFRRTVLDLITITSCYDEPWQIQNGKYYFQSRSQNSRVEYECDDGYEVRGHSTVQCLNGEWTGQLPHCVRANLVVSVGQVATTTGMSINPTQKPVASKEPSLGGDDDCSCIYNNPDRIVIAKYFRKRLQYGDKVRKDTWTELTCLDQAMHLVLPNGAEIPTRTANLTCNVCRTWEVDLLPTCVFFYHPGLTCPRIVVTNDIEVKYTVRRRVGSTATFRCIDTTFILVGNSTKCLENGMWDSYQNPYCQTVSCDPPNNPEKGRVTYVSLEFGSELKFECEAGYALEDTTPVHCTSDGTWSKTDVTCIEKKCEVPQKPEHGSVEFIGSAASPMAGTIALFTCEGEYKPSGPTYSKCLATGDWTFDAPLCLEPCNIPFVQNGKIGKWVSQSFNRDQKFQEIRVGQRIDESDKFFLHCSNGYHPMGITTNWQAMMTCKDGKWSSDPFCELATCRAEPPVVENGKVEKMDRKHGGTVSYECLSNFKKVKTGNVNCNMGVWRGAPPTCKDAPPCPSVNISEVIPKNVIHVKDDVTNSTMPYNSTVKLECLGDKNLVGDSFARCGSDGKWKVVNITCISGCPPFVKGAGSGLFIKPKKDVYKIGDYVTLSCTLGQKLSTDLHMVMCLQSGWSESALPECIMSDVIDDLEYPTSDS